MIQTLFLAQSTSELPIYLSNELLLASAVFFVFGPCIHGLGI